MKNLLNISLIIILFAVGSRSFAQWYGIKGGYNLAKKIAKNDAGDFSDRYTNKDGYQLGLFMQFPIRGAFSFEPGLMIASKGYITGWEGTYQGELIKTNLTTTLTYLDIPVAAKASCKVGKVKIYGVVGPYLGIGLSGEGKSAKTTVSTSQTFTDFYDLKFGSDKGSDNFKRIDLGIKAGTGIDFRKIQLSVTYGMGLRNLSLNSDNNTISKNRVLEFSMAYKIGYGFNSPDYRLRIKAVKRTYNQSKLQKLVLEDEDINVRIAALDKITDQDFIKKIAIESNENELRMLAIEKVTDQNIIYKIALEDISYDIKIAAMNRLTPGLLAKLATEFSELGLKYKVIDLLTDQIELMNISQNNDTWELRKAAFKKLDDNSLVIISQEAKDPALILSAKIRLGQISWNEAFTDKLNSTVTLGDVIGAAAIVDTPQPTQSDVVFACHNFIQLGDASRIPELIYLLNKFGDKYLAEDYMNCGESSLEDAGCKWGREHGYSCGTGNNGSNRVRWGSKK